MAGPYIEAANAGVQPNKTAVFLDHEFSHGEVLTALNEHPEPQPSSAPSALFGTGLPWHYAPTDTHIAGVFPMAEHILSHEGEDGELAETLYNLTQQ